jgi:uncharacterized protein (DUF4213/DUF364 family)
MTAVDDLLNTIPDGELEDLRLGAFWTAAVVRSGGRRRCGLASNPLQGGHCHGAGASVREAGSLLRRSAAALAELARSSRPLEASMGMAAINALLPPLEEHYVDLNAEELIARHGRDKNVVLVGNFPFVPRLRASVRRLEVLEQEPRGGDLPAGAASKTIPRADLLALTGMTLLNGTFEPLMAMRGEDALVLVIGPTTPLSTVLFRHGVTYLAGSVVREIDAVLRAVSQGGNFRQIRRAGVRLVTLRRED